MPVENIRPESCNTDRSLAKQADGQEVGQVSVLNVSSLLRTSGSAKGGETLSGSSGKERLKKACLELESVFWNQLLKAMRNTIQHGGFIGKGPGEELFMELLDQEYSAMIPSAQKNGLAEQLYRQLSGTFTYHTTHQNRTGMTGAVEKGPGKDEDKEL